MDIIRECRQVAPHCPRRPRRVALWKPRSRFQVVKRKRALRHSCWTTPVSGKALAAGHAGNHRRLVVEQLCLAGFITSPTRKRGLHFRQRFALAGASGSLLNNPAISSCPPLAPCRPRRTTFNRNGGEPENGRERACCQPKPHGGLPHPASRDHLANATCSRFRLSPQETSHPEQSS